MADDPPDNPLTAFFGNLVQLALGLAVALVGGIVGAFAKAFGLTSEPDDDEPRAE